MANQFITNNIFYLESIQIFLINYYGLCACVCVRVDSRWPVSAITRESFNNGTIIPIPVHEPLSLSSLHAVFCRLINNGQSTNAKLIFLAAHLECPIDQTSVGLQRECRSSSRACPSAQRTRSMRPRQITSQRRRFDDKRLQEGDGGCCWAKCTFPSRFDMD